MACQWPSLWCLSVVSVINSKALTLTAYGFWAISSGDRFPDIDRCLKSYPTDRLAPDSSRHYDYGWTLVPSVIELSCFPRHLVAEVIP
eukprot:scaffold55186_cov21-Prasinocladus_malaysianus.AAC.1